MVFAARELFRDTVFGRKRRKHRRTFRVQACLIIRDTRCTFSQRQLLLRRSVTVPLVRPKRRRATGNRDTSTHVFARAKSNLSWGTQIVRDEFFVQLLRKFARASGSRKKAVCKLCVFPRKCDLVSHQTCCAQGSLSNGCREFGRQGSGPTMISGFATTCTQYTTNLFPHTRMQTNVLLQELDPKLPGLEHIVFAS